MKRFCCLLFLLSATDCYGQKQPIRDSLLSRIFVMAIRPPECIDCDYAGISLLKVYIKSDSVKLKTIYAAGNGYNFDNAIALSKILNSKCRNYISKKDIIVIPIYFYYDKNGALYTPSPEKEIVAKKKLKRLKKKIEQFQPIILTVYSR